MSELKFEKITPALIHSLRYPLERFRNSTQYGLMRAKYFQDGRSKEIIIEITQIMEEFIELLKPLLPLEFNFESCNLVEEDENVSPVLEKFQIVFDEFWSICRTQLYSKEMLEQLFAKEHVTTVFFLVELGEKLEFLAKTL